MSKKIFILTETQIKKIVDNVIGEQSALTNQGDYGFQPTQIKNSPAMPSGNTGDHPWDIPNIPSNRQIYINNVWGSVKNGIIHLPGNDIDGWKWNDWILKWPLSPQEITIAKQSNPTAELTKAAPVAKKVNFIPNEKYPLKFQQMGGAIKQIQGKLGVPQTGNFWVKTEAAIKAIAPEYNRQTGITKDIWNKVMGTTPGQSSVAAQTALNQTAYNKNVGVQQAQSKVPIQKQI